MPSAHSTPYLFLLRRPSVDARRSAARWLRELGATVVAQYGDGAIEALVTPERARAASEIGLFSAQLKGPMSAEHLENLGPGQRAIVELWNARFSSGYRELEKDLSMTGRSWGEPEVDEPLPYSAIDAEDFERLVSEYEDRTGDRLIKPGERDDERPQERLTGEEFVDFERRLADRYDNPTLAYHLARLAQRLGPRHRDVLLRLPDELIEELIRRFFREAACWRMTGEMSVGLVFVESSRADGPAFSTSERNEICQEILAGHSWLTSQHPSGELSWVYDFQFVRIDVPDGAGDPDEAYWRDPAMGQVAFNGATYAAAWSGVADYRDDMRVANRSAHAFVIFVTPYANSWHAYAGGGRITLAKRNNWGGWGRGTIDMITAHETGHLFGAADEYTGSGTPCSSCDTLHGCDNIPNGNCGACAHPRQDCAMDGNSRRLCGYTRGQIGWSHLFVETTTADVSWAGTDDDVWIDIGEQAFVLDTPDHDDRERDNREGYAIWSPELEPSDIKRILIRKSPDGFAGGWRLAHVRVWHAGELICDTDVDRWLEDDHRWWIGCIRDRRIVNSLRIEVSTGDVAWAGTDDDVTLTLAGRNWNLDNEGHDDFERGNTDMFDLDPQSGLHRSDIHSIRIHKSPDGFAGGWRLHGIKLIVNGATLYDNHSVDRWIEDDDRTWSATF
jgi:hypothetical protein